MKYRISSILIVVYLFIGCSTSRQAEDTSETVSGEDVTEQINIIPKPQAVSSISGDDFVINKTTKIRYEPGENGFKEDAKQLSRALKEQTGLTLNVEPIVEGDHSNKIILTSATTEKIPREGYQLNVDANQITIRAATSAGAFYGVQSLRQLVPLSINKNTDSKRWNVPALSIEDSPRFSWRGMHLDVSRHFFSVETVKELIDYMAYYKFNKLHMHLTDDQGWRLQIKQYPKLTKEGGWRTFNDQDSVAIKRAKTNPDFKLPEKHIRRKNGKKEYGGFYTQKQMQQIIDYAKARHITIVPEIDMPGHLMSAITSFPELSCTGKADWGETFSVPVCPCKESTYTFLENVLDEVAGLFPGKYIHIGADEVDKTTWKQSDNCQQMMDDKEMENAEELQSYFVDRMARYLQSKGKKVIGWDEITQGGIPDNMTMMYWRNWAPKALKTAAQNGNHIIMAPSSTLYFNADQTPSSLQEVYNYDPLPDSFSDKQDSLILGAQGELWSEWIPSKDRLFYMAMPRMLALAEVDWSSKQHRNWDDFSRRIQPHYTRLDMKKVNYRQPDLKGFHPQNVFIDTAQVHFKKPRKDITLYYTTDGSEPTRASKKYEEPFTLTETTNFRLKTFLPTGKAGESYKTKYVQQDPKPSTSIQNPTQGLQLQYSDGAYHTVDDFHFKQDSSVKRMSVGSFNVPAKIDTMPTFGLQFDGYINVPSKGVYTFYTSTDDGSKLFVGGDLVVNNDGPHSEMEKSTNQVALEAGYHPIRLKFFELGGGHALHVYYKGPGISKQRLPAEILFH